MLSDLDFLTLLPPVAGCLPFSDDTEITTSVDMPSCYISLVQMDEVVPVRLMTSPALFKKNFGFVSLSDSFDLLDLEAESVLPRHHGH